MSKLQFVTATGNALTDPIFKGVFGTLNEEGAFEVAAELKGIYLFTLLTPQTLKAQGVDLSSNLAEIEVADADMASVKATMLNALKTKWLTTYDRTLAQLGAGMARGAVQAERIQVATAVEQALQSLALQPHEVTLESSFSNHRASLNLSYDDDDNDNDDDEGLMSTEVFALDIASDGWRVAENEVDLSGLSDVHQTDEGSVNFASGRLVTKATLYGENPVAVVVAMNALPYELKSMTLGNNVRFAEVEWHDHRRDTSNEVAVEAAEVLQIPFVEGNTEVTDDDFSNPAPAP